jgi:hypothetical protein
MSKYSFLLQSEEPEFFDLTPKVRLRKHGGWLVAEGIEQEELSKAQSQATIRAVQLAKRIATAKGIALDEAFALLQGGADMSEMELLSDFTEETLGMINSGGSVEIGNARMVTVFIRCRGEGLIGDEWLPLDDWSIEDTKGMGRRVISQGHGIHHERTRSRGKRSGTSKKNAPPDEGSVAEQLEKQARQFLKSLTKWDEIYFRLNASDFEGQTMGCEQFRQAAREGRGDCFEVAGEI